MNAEALILSGTLLIASGVVWLISENSKTKTQKQKSITESYRKFRGNIWRQRIYMEAGILAIILGGWVWWRSDRNLMWTALWILTCIWFIRMKRSVFLTGVLFLIGEMLAFYNIQLGLVWLLTVVGIGYFDYNSPREKQPWYAQMAVVLNPAGALGKLISLSVPKIKLEDLKSLEVTELPDESLVDCPVCKTAMKLHKTMDGAEKIVFDKCPKCNAVWFDDKDWLWAVLKIQKSKNPRVQKTADVKCPRCQIKLNYNKAENYYFCPVCLGNLVI